MRYAAIIQLPWRHEEFYIAHAYVDICLRIRRDFILRKVRFLVVENDMNQIILGALFGRRYFGGVSRNDSYVTFVDDNIQVDIPSTRKTFMPRIHILTEEEILERRSGT